MNKELESRQITETRSLLQKAGQRNAPPEIKRGALLRLIGLVHTSSSALKIFAAQHFSQYFKDFPDLEEQVIHSVYDICEDTDSQVRVEGYKAIVSLSVESRKWTKRNTDVLVQLLQSDEPKELLEIEEALLKHIDLDPVAALGVLCDNCIVDPDQSSEEQMDRARLRKLVLLFIANRAMDRILKHFNAVDDSPAERVYREGLLKTIPDADFEETELIVKELLIPVRSFTSQSERGDGLLRVLLDKTQAIYTKLKAQPGLLSLDPVKPYLSLLDFVSIIKRIANPAPLLRFYSLSLIGKMALQKLDAESQADIIHRLSSILDICEEQRVKEKNNESAQDLLNLRNMVVDASPHLLERLLNSRKDDEEHWNTFISLLRACRQRQKEQHWTPPTNLITIIVGMDALEAESESVPADTVQTLKSLVKEIRTESEKSTTKPSLTPRPTSVIGQKRKLSLESQNQSHNAVQARRPPHSSPQPPRRKSDIGSSTLSTTTQKSTIITSSTKSEHTNNGNSLLSRLQGEVKFLDRVASSGITKQMEHVTISQPSSLGISIKGAAAANARLGSGKAASPVVVPPIPSNPALIDRLAQSENSARKKRRK